MLVTQLKKLTIEQQLMKLKKITDHDHSNKYINTQEFNKLTSENFASTFAQANLASKNDIANFVKKTDFDDKLTNLNKKNISSIKKGRYLSKINLKNQRHLSQILIGHSYFFKDGAQLYLIFETLYYN